MNEILILENQISIMEVLFSISNSSECHQKLHEQIQATYDRIKELKEISGK